MAIVIYLNGTSPSECRHSLCWLTKGHLWIEGCLKHYRWACYELHSLSIQLSIFTFEYVNCCTRLCLYTTRVHTGLFLQHVVYCTRLFVIETCVQICTRASLRETHMSYAGSSINTHVHFPLTLKVINHDYLRFVKPLTITILTISTSSTLEIALFH